MRYPNLILSGIVTIVLLVSCDNSKNKGYSPGTLKDKLSIENLMSHDSAELFNRYKKLNNNFKVKTVTHIQRDTDYETKQPFKNTQQYFVIQDLKQFSPKYSTVSQAKAISGDTAFFRPPIASNAAIGSFIWPFSKLTISLDNDLFCNTDRYYTNGIQVKWQSPAFAFWRINSIFPLNQSNCMEYNSLELHHGMYTPFTTKVPPLLKNDRPYASSIFVRFERRTDNPIKRTRQIASLDIGMIGEAALGSLLQKGVHAGLPSNDEPLGWETQIANDLVLNYNYQYNRLLTPLNRNVNTYLTGAASIGTLNTSVSTGIGLRIINSGYYMVALPGTLNELAQTSSSKWLLTFDANLTTSLVGYNATLSGGFLNNNSLYVLKPEEIERLLINAELKFEASYGKYGITLAQYYISKEFKEGKSHFWGQIGLNIGF